jgi:hypothetical protein
MEQDVKMIYLRRKEQNHNALLALCGDGKKELTAEHQVPERLKR